MLDSVDFLIVLHLNSKSKKGIVCNTADLVLLTKEQKGCVYQSGMVNLLKTISFLGCYFMNVLYFIINFIYPKRVDLLFFLLNNR